jgi:para-aminobenzoate synthetase component I
MPYSVSLPYRTDAAGYYAAIAGLPWAVWLDSGSLARYDILAAEPVATLVTRDGLTEITDANGTRRTAGDPFDLLRAQLGEPCAPMPDIPFAGGALGYWGYDLMRRADALPGRAIDAGQLPQAMIGIYDWAIVLDHHRQAARLVSCLRDPATEVRLPEIARRVEEGRMAPCEAFKVEGEIAANCTPAQYQSAFDRVKAYLLEGDCYQVNLALRYDARASGHALAAYLKLRQLSPAPYSAFLDLPGVQILSASPERFIRVGGSAVETRPIKGTRARIRDAVRDGEAARELQNSAKDRAENLMIVDLLRNDLGKSCIPGSVKVPRLFEVESFADVHHLVSTITGTLCAGQDAGSLLRDCLPGGSVTGAPKARAMEIIEELEPGRRGVYCGAIGYIGHDGNMDSNIAIRTLVYSGSRIRFWAGGGIVADSEMASEFQEIQDKAKSLRELLTVFGAGR